MRAKNAGGFLKPFLGLARSVICIPIPGEINAADPHALAAQTEMLGFETGTADSTTDAARMIAGRYSGPQRILICGSLYLAGHVLAENG